MKNFFLYIYLFDLIIKATYNLIVIPFNTREESGGNNFEYILKYKFIKKKILSHIIALNLIIIKLKYLYTIRNRRATKKNRFLN